MASRVAASFALAVARALGTVTCATLATVACGSEDSPSFPSATDTGSGSSSGAGATGAGAATSSSSGEGGGSPTGAGGAGGSGAAGGSGGSGGGRVYGFPDAWPNGTACASEEDVFVWKYADDTFILRQSLCTNFEGPFWYLLFGEDKALLVDTGTGAVDTAAVVQNVVSQYLASTGKPSIELVVTHSHGHGDHVGGDGYFSGKPGVTVVGPSKAAVQSFFGIASWPTQIVAFDLGNRVIDVIPIPGHQSAHLAFYDRRHDLLLTGDTLYPGRLYIETWSEYRESIPRVVDFVSVGNPVSWVLGTHIEMTKTPKQDFPFGASQHANEHELELGYDVLLELDAAVAAMGQTPVYQEHDDFIIVP